MNEITIDFGKKLKERLQRASSGIQGRSCEKCQHLINNKVMIIGYRSTLSTITASFATLLAIGQFRQVDSPIKTSIAQSSQQSYGSESTKPDPSKEENSQIKPPEMSEQLKKAKEGALWGMLITDAMAMPVHWYYNPSDIKRGYGGWLTGFRAPNKNHPSSILTLSAVDGSGRTGWHSKSKQIIGSVILHDKLKYWQSRDSSTHYHQGMKAGENTLNSVVALEFLKTMNKLDPHYNKPDRELRGDVLQHYVQFMTTPGSHNDTYAESFHRSFFKDWACEDKKLTTAEELLDFTDRRFAEKLKGRDDSQLVVIGALAPAIPWILRNAHKSEDECARQVIEFIKCTHPVKGIISYIDMYARLLHGVINGRDLKQEVLRVMSHAELGGPQKREMILKLLEKSNSFPEGSEDRLKAYQMATQMLGSACYIEGALSSMLLLAYEFADNFEAGVLTNANCGGENCHRGAALGALLGAQAVNSGQGIPQKLKDGLHAKDDVYEVFQQNNL